MTVQIRYPSGHSFSLHGRLVYVGCVAQDGKGNEVMNTFAPVFETDDGKVWVLDPRGYIEADGRLLYDPRKHIKYLRAFAGAAWVKENAEWLKETT